MTEAIRAKAIKDLTLHLAFLKDQLTATASRKAMNGVSPYMICAAMTSSVRNIEATKKAITYFKKLKIQTTPKP